VRLLLVALAACLPATGSAQQRVTVEAPSARSTVAVLRLWRRDGSCWRAVAGPWRARVGWNGLSANRHEGDGTTPIGTFGFQRVMYGIAPSPGVRYAYRRVRCGDWWDEDARSPTYNTFQRVGCGRAPPFESAAGEGLWRATRAYRHFAVIDFNTHPVVPGRGSGIFLHVETGGPTNGCVSLPVAQLKQVLRWLDPAKSPQITITASA
jgi:L,D-peptidoglycan transpeptidase YkuD (ErfK/YbiS/YcfS/YnhG family)